MYKYLITLLVILTSCLSSRQVHHSSPLIENAIAKNKEIKINVVRDGDVYTDPDDHYEISIIKKDSLYFSTCIQRNTTTNRVLTKRQLNELAHFEKKISRERNRAGLCNISVEIIVDGKLNAFNIGCSEDNLFNTLRR